MFSSATVAAQLDLRSILQSGGVVIMAILLWLILSLISSFFLKGRGPLRGLLNQLRFLFFPSLVFYLVVLTYWQPAGGPPTTLLKVAQTVLAASTVILGMGILNLFLAPQVLRRWFRRDVPALLIDVLRYVIIVLAVAVILSSVWGAEVTPLIGALGVGGIVLGLALQETLSNFFSGLAILAERPFSIGDWIQIGEGRQGQVEHVTWRAVKIRTGDNEYVIYPNSIVAKEKVTNFNLPTPVQARRITVGTSYRDPPDLVKQTILEVLADVPGVLADPAPVIYTVAYADFSINYEVKFFIDDFAAHRVIEDRVMSRLWYAFRRRGIEIPYPTRHVYHFPLPPPGGAGDGPEEMAEERPGERPGHGKQTEAALAAPPPPSGKEEVLRALSGSPLFAELSTEEQMALAAPAALVEYGYGERVIRQAEPGETLYAIVSGQARVAVRGEDGLERDVALLKKGDVFGEMSLLTGEPRTASVYGHGGLRVAEVGKAALAPLLTGNPGLAARMAEVVVLRRAGLDRAQAEAAEAAKRREIESAAATLLGRIRSFFNLKR